MMLSSMFTKMLEGEGREGRDKRAMNNVLGKGRTTGWGFPLPFFCKGGQEGWRREATREEDAHSIVFLQKPVGGKQSLSFSELIS